MGEEKKGLIFQFISNWKYKDFTLGAIFVTQSLNDEIREYYIGFYLGFWQLFVGFKI